MVDFLYRLTVIKSLPVGQRAENRNHATAKLYERLGLASYEAIEAFVQYHV